MFKILIAVLAGLASLFFIALVSDVPFDMRSWLLQSKSRFVVGSDFEQTKITYRNLFDSNTGNYHLAGEPAFPINTDTLRYVTSEEINQYQQENLRELLNSLAYERKERLERIAIPVAEKRVLRIYTNQPRQIVSTSSARRIKKLILRTTDALPLGQVELSLTRKTQPGDKRKDIAKSQKIAELLRTFATLHSTGESPVGANFRVSFDEFVRVYGYGQCANLSYAFCDLLNQHSIKTQLIRLPDSAHTLLEAETESGWMAVDPRLEIAFMDPAGQRPLSFAEVQANLDRIIQMLHLTPATAKDLRRYYHSKTFNPEPYQPAPTQYDYTFTLTCGEAVEYEFDSTYPWLAAREVKSPPTGVLGAFKQKFHLQGSKQLRLPFPVVDVEANFSNGPATLSVNYEEASFNPSWDFVRLRRYLEHGDRELQLAVKDNPAGIDITVVSQFSRLPFNTNSGAILLVKADRDAQVEVEVEFY